MNEKEIDAVRNNTDLYEAQLCEACKLKICKEVAKAKELLDSPNPIKRRMGQLMAAKKSVTLYQKLCPTCLSKIKKVIK